MVTAKLQSENQRIKTEIYETVHGITQVRVPDEEVSSTDWCWILSACVETQILQTNHEELWDRHLNSPCEITADIYAEMVRKHGDLRRLYEQALKSHAALQDGYNRFARQLTIPCSVRPHLPLVALANFTTLAAQRPSTSQPPRGAETSSFTFYQCSFSAGR